MSSLSIRDNSSFFDKEIHTVACKKQQYENRDDSDYLNITIKVFTVVIAIFAMIAIASAKPVLAWIGLTIVVLITLTIFYHSRKISTFFYRMPHFFIYYTPRPSRPTRPITVHPIPQPRPSSSYIHVPSIHRERSGRGGSFGQDALHGHVGFGQGSTPPLSHQGSGRGNNLLNANIGFGQGSVPPPSSQGSGRGNNPINANIGFGQGQTLPPQQQGNGGGNNPLRTNEGFGSRTKN